MTAPVVLSPFPESYRAPYDPHPDPELLEELRGSPSHIKERVKNQAKRDRYFLAKGVLGYQDVNEYTHGPLCRALQDRSKNRRMYLMHRGSLKTTIATVTDLVGDSLEDPDNFCCLIVQEILEIGQSFLAEIKAHFQQNELVHELFPELIPEKFGGPGSRWSLNRACLNRNSTLREWTWNVVGVGGAVVGRHFRKIKCDDLIGFEAYTSPAALSFAIKYAKALSPLLINMDEDFIDFVGTRWMIGDLYRHVLNMYGDRMLYFAREDIEVVPENVSDEVLRSAGFKGDLKLIRGTEQPIFPRKFSLGGLRELEQIDPALYYAQYKNNPIAEGLTDFNADNLNYFDFDAWGNVVYRDRATRLLLRWRLEELDIVMVVDPNSGELTSPDFPAIGVFGLSARNQMFALDMWSRRVQPDSFVDQIFEMYKKWQNYIRVAGGEKAGQQNTNFYFRKKARDEKLYINFVDLKPKNRDKPSRIRKALQPFINLGDFYLHKNHQTLRHQVRFHPHLENDDELDTAAYATELFIRPNTQEERDEEDKMVQKISNSRSPVTGYGR